jgi:hypothetical protein
VSPLIGSRKASTTVYFDANNVQVSCGCFAGTMEEFKEAVKEKYGDNNYAQKYMQFIKRVEKYITKVRRDICVKAKN